MLVSQDPATSRLTLALIDFGDMCYTWAVTEAAVTIMYAMLLVPPASEGGRPLEAGASVLVGACLVFQLLPTKPKPQYVT